jgi:hypothetical protein
MKIGQQLWATTADGFCHFVEITQLNSRVATVVLVHGWEEFRVLISMCHTNLISHLFMTKMRATPTNIAAVKSIVTTLLSKPSFQGQIPGKTKEELKELRDGKFGDIEFLNKLSEISKTPGLPIHIRKMCDVSTYIEMPQAHG